MTMRASGILMPISSLPSDYGIGCFDQEAYKFVDQLAKADQSYWQILPLGPTGYGDSPYQSFSTYAGNPYFISLADLIKEKLLTNEECQQVDWGHDDTTVDYERIYRSRFILLRKAYDRSMIYANEDFAQFVSDNEYWLEDYALYTAIKAANDGQSFMEWDEELKTRQKKELEIARERLADEISFVKFQQFLFFKQWNALKQYANNKGISIIGDIPIYVALDSVDSWANPELFQFDVKMQPISVAGCPPDNFSEDGQLWGNPLYNWKYHIRTGFRWWINRIEHCMKLYDVTRIDHFRGFDAYYAIPFGEKNAVHGKWEKGPGIQFFHALKEKLPDVNIIAEDLGFLTDSVRDLLKQTQFPGMKVLQFAFDSREESDYLPHLYDKNSVVYTGTHDNDTTLGLITQNEEVKENMIEYMQCEKTASNELLTYKLICLAMSSVSDLCIIPLQDYLMLGSEARINTPSTLGGNWAWRLQKNKLTNETIKNIKLLTKLYSRKRKYN